MSAPLQSASLTPEYFDGLYAANPDPWSFETSAYESAKYDATLAALSPARAAHGLEVGCSIGVLTRRLAAICDDLLAVDVADAALAQARRRCADQANVRFARMQAPEQWPDRPFDLIVLSEVLYYFDLSGIDAVAARVRTSMLPGARVLLVHWLGATNYPTGGDAAVERFIAASAGTLAIRDQSRTPEYRLDLLG